MPCFSSAHHTLHYVTQGSANNPPLLLLHGFLGSHQDFVPLLRTLSDYFYCLVLDLPGHGQTKTEPNGYTFAKTADSLLALLRYLNIRETHLLGYSMGGRLALYLTCAFPDCFRRVVLESASPGLKTAAERAQRRESDDAIAHRLETTPLPIFLTQWYQNPLFNSLQNHPQAYTAMIQRRTENDSVELAKALRGFSTGRQPSLWEKLPQITTPLCLVTGSLDDKFVYLNRKMLSVLPTVAHSSTKLDIINACGHNVHLEARDLYLNSVVPFLTQTSLL